MISKHYFLSAFLAIAAITFNCHAIDNSLPASFSDFELYEDTVGNISLDDIKTKKLAFKKMEWNSITMKNPNHYYWIKLKVLPNLGSPLIFINPIVLLYHSITLYIPERHDVFAEQHLGLTYPISKQLMKNKDGYFIIPLSDEPINCIFRAQPRGLMPFILNQVSVETMPSVLFNFLFYQGLFFGIILIIAIYNMAMFIINKEGLYFYYFAYILFFGIYALTDWLYIYQFFEGIKVSDRLFRNLYILPITMMVLTYLTFTRGFLQTKEKFPVYDGIIKIAIIGRIAVYFAGEIFYVELNNQNADVLFVLVPFILGITVFIQGFKPARYFTASAFFVFLAFLVHSKIGILDLVPDNIFKADLLNLIGLLDIVLFAFALADRYRLLKIDKEVATKKLIVQLQENEKLKTEANKELEVKVLERTNELILANKKLENQSIEIAKMNELLKEDNIKLEHNVEVISKARVMQNKVTFEEFKAIYPNDEACLQYLSDLKWSKGFQCKKCKNTTYSFLPHLHSRKCNKCHYSESATVDTIFHNLKFSIVKAFYILFLTNSKNEITVQELSKQIDLRTETCWTFKKKVLSSIKAVKRSVRNKKDGWSYLIINSANRIS